MQFKGGLIKFNHSILFVVKAICVYTCCRAFNHNTCIYSPCTNSNVIGVLKLVSVQHEQFEALGDE